MFDLVEPWVVKSALVVSLMAAANAWLYVLSVRLDAEERSTPTSARSARLGPTPTHAPALRDQRAERHAA